MISQSYWQNCYTDAGLETPECWKEGLLKPHNHTVSVSDLAFIGGWHGMVDLKVGEIQRFTSDGQGVELKDGSKMEVDIVIKCTGFHLQDVVPKITGFEKMYPSGLITTNMAYLAEPLLDGGQFGSSKGKVDSEEVQSGTDDIIFYENADKVQRLPPNIAKMLQGRSNPFGSGYAGGLMVNSDFMAWMAANPEKQKHALSCWKEPRMPVIRHWVSHIGTGSWEVVKEMVGKALTGPSPSN